MTLLKSRSSTLHVSDDYTKHGTLGRQMIRKTYFCKFKIRIWSFRFRAYWFNLNRAVSIKCHKTKSITTVADNPVNQSELVANTCYRRQARENACEQVTIGFGLTSDWLIKWRENFFSQSQSVKMQIQSIQEITFHAYLKTAVLVTHSDSAPTYKWLTSLHL